MLYLSDHGEDIFDDPRHLFLHASPVPSYYQLHIPFLIWMSDSYREAFVMHRFKELSYKEIAEVLDVSPQTVAYRIQQALKLLHVSLKDYLPMLVWLVG